MSSNLDTVRMELFKCLEQSDVAQKDKLSGKEVLNLPAENFPSECADLRRAFEEVVSTAAVDKNEK